jgi:hypothetical protein
MEDARPGKKELQRQCIFTNSMSEELIFSARIMKKVCGGGDE